jgi:LysM repeat protein
MAMLIQGCKREPVEPTSDISTPSVDTNSPFAMDTNPPVVESSNPPVIPPPIVSNPPVPVPVVPPPVAVEPAGAEYVVVKGDSLSKIAKNNHVSLKALMAANPGVVPTKLKVGQKLIIPAATSSAAAPSTSTAASTGAGEDIYVVKSGDTLTKIARMHGTTIKAIESENNLTTTKIKVGQKLKIPGKAEAAVPVSTPEPAPTATPMVTPLPSNSTAQ